MNDSPEGTSDPLRCDGCSRESWPDGALVLVVEEEPKVKTVRHVRITCGKACSERSPAEYDVVVHEFAAMNDVFDYADRVIAAHDWERGTVQRLSRVLAAIHRRRTP